MQLHNRVVARFTDGRVLKGTTQDFAVGRDYFHVIPPETGAEVVRVSLATLKAVFFVKNHAGNKDYNEKKAFDKPVPGRKLQVTFRDGEVLVGSSDRLRRRPSGVLHDPGRSEVEQRSDLRGGPRGAIGGVHPVAADSPSASRPV